MKNQITFAAIHGAILSIIIGLSSLYVFNLSNIYTGLEQNTVSEALRVNKIKTNPAWYESSNCRASSLSDTPNSFTAQYHKLFSFTYITYFFTIPHSHAVMLAVLSYLVIDS